MSLAHSAKKKKSEILTEHSHIIIYGKNISQSQSFEETEIFYSSQESMFSLRAGECFYAGFWHLPHLLPRIGK
ncbi:hypothetical protein A2823_01770 [Candidatus Nomurabacteria bacterium RIFCSPHIGHO2_01_FULL_41_91]|uniref:Uncharacterized protein n=1 Tax=Candidatus Nomurabacteria bacterium RIFCSPLOWO2_12_FULL_41_10 TaxID=1801795 RepID=A0A1F6Y9S7_9BACT|nr:MAG: hypothetical protein A2823_01770 [Candidatus Nomurabacteria bacterium RIFCSPHIGHO2_01_FULL_41_91]OGI80268.1 MAG: hypothetical protein A3D43_01155 [Candidatus Nomurabacteria bacterium RIFCSPHIGHO2_02_FULL_41_52]OGI84998.1 MAG: hypothetical protein A3F49_00620 [Candidatus Nomurabacteria bacterium RIFCSPHIGHO2_12_FULL_42_19]OGI94166.1 MAG: hypothetical protein A3A07_00190 [Candidatus Nomurabacteria bacterium RIFCSPLOWO2_01_FULL_41_52]OGI98003.1 MAG: hypothetical protein A3H56_02450 [Candid